MKIINETLSSVKRRTYIEHIGLNKWLTELLSASDFVLITNPEDLEFISISAQYYIVDFEYCPERTQTLRILYRSIGKGKIIVLSAFENIESDYLIGSIFNVHAFLIKDTLERRDLLNALKDKPSPFSLYLPQVTHGVFLPFDLNYALSLFQSTDQEKKVFVEVIRGKKNKEIASKFNIGIRTVETYRSNLVRRSKSQNFLGVIIKIVAYAQAMEQSKIKN
jgi:DNA-binding NarL/FixJ family response regulator